MENSKEVHNFVEVILTLSSFCLCTELHNSRLNPFMVVDESPMNHRRTQKLEYKSTREKKLLIDKNISKIFLNQKGNVYDLLLMWHSTSKLLRREQFLAACVIHDNIKNNYMFEWNCLLSSFVFVLIWFYHNPLWKNFFDSKLLVG